MIFRVFVSSTFSDMLHEREALRQQVFPRLQTLCRQHRSHFQVVDLRWGVSQAAAQSQRTMDICLEEIARCRRMTSRPNFIALLGDRYGWCPIPSHIPAQEFELLRCALRDQGKTSAASLLEHWYQLDKNASPAKFILQPQTEPWAEVEVELADVLREAARNLSDSIRWRYTASATEQEIQAGLLDPAREQGAAFAFLRTFRELPVGHDRSHEFVDLGIDGAVCSRLRGQLLQLRESVAKALGKRAFLYEADWRNDDVTTDHIPQFVEDAFRSLEEIVLRELRAQRQSNGVIGDYLRHENFGKSHICGPRGEPNYVGRRRQLVAARNYVTGNDSAVLIVHGLAGVGKTAFLAAVADRARDWLPGSAVISRFAGATPGSADPAEFLHRLSVMLSRACNLEEKNIPRGYNELVPEFRRRLDEVPPDRPIILIIDGFEHFRSLGQASGLEWLPTMLPEGVRMIVSTRSGDPLIDLEGQLEEIRVIQLPVLGLEDASQLLDRWLTEAGRVLQPSQRNLVLRRFAESGLPLYLRFAFEEALRWRSFDRAALAPTVKGMIGSLLQRLESPRDHGHTLVERSLLYIAACRDGLAEDELLQLLSQDTDVLRDFRRRSPDSPLSEVLPDIVWSRLYFELEPYFLHIGEGMTKLDFRRREFHEVVAERYATKSLERRTHLRLAGFFRERALPIGGATPDEHALSELPHQVAACNQRPELKRLLTNYEFLYNKLVSLGSAKLIEDFWLVEDSESSPVRSLQRALERGAHALEANPDELPSQLFGRLLNHRSKRLHELLDQAKRSSGGFWFRPLTPSLLQPSALLRTLVGHTERVNTLVELPDRQRLISASNDNTIRLWHLDSGVELRQFRMHDNWVKSVAVHRNGKLAVSCGFDGNLYIWEVNSGSILHTLPCEGERLWVAAFSPDGRRVIAAVDYDIQVWDFRSRRLLRTLEGHTGEVVDVAVAEVTGRIASIAEDGTVRVWSLRGAGETTLRGEDVEAGVGWKHTDSGTQSLHPDWDAQFVALTPDGRFVLAARRDETVRIRDIRTRKEVGKLQGHDGTITSLAVGKDGNTVLTGSYDRTIKLWNLTNSQLIRTVGRHSDGVTAVAFARNDRWALSGSDDHTIRIWDLQAPKRASRGFEHPKSAESLAVTATRFISASEDGTICLWDSRTGSMLRRFFFDECMVQAIAATPDGRRLILHGTGHSGPATYSCNLTGKRRFRYLGGGGEFSYGSLSITPDGRWLIAAHWLGAELYELSSFTKKQELDHTSAAFSMSTDGRRILAANRPGIRIVPVGRGKQRRIRCNDDIWKLAMSPDNKLIAGGLRDGSLRIWDARTCRALTRLPGHEDGIVGLEFSRDSGMLLSASLDRTIHCREVATGNLRASFTGTSAMTNCCLSRDGRTLIAGESNGRVHVLRLEGLHRWSI
jgi:WD40 repeat protein